MAEEMKIKITANGRQARQELSKTKTSVKGVGTSILNLRNALIGLGVGAGVRAITNVSARYEELNNRLRLITDSQEQLTNQFKLLSSAAIANRTGIEETIELYSKLRVATEELGVADERVLTVTNRLSRALQLAGADTMTAQAVIRQFGQAMASGTVRGDEFRSIVEGLGPALSIMARQTGISVGKLREMSLAGKLTAETMFEMLENASIIDDEFNNLTPTINSLEVAFGDAFNLALIKFGELSGITDAYKKTIEDLTYLLNLFSKGQMQFLNLSVAEMENLVATTDDYEGALKILEQTLKNVGEQKGPFGVDTGAFDDYIEKLKLNIQLLKDRIDIQNKINSQQESQDKKEDKPVVFDKQIKALQRFVLDEKALLVEQYNDRIQTVKKFLKDNENLTVEQKEKLNRLVISLERKLGDELHEIRKKQIIEEAEQRKEQARIRKQIYDDNLKAIRDFNMQDLTLNKLSRDQKKDIAMQTGRDAISALAKHNRAMFALNKALALKDAIVSTAQGVSKALAMGPFGIPLAIGIGALGAAQVATIAQTQYQGRRMGGNVNKDQPYIVGEAGPELFVPKEQGTIIPNHKMGGQPVNVNFNINTVDARGFNELLVNSRGLIVNMINSAVNEKGKQAIV